MKYIKLYYTHLPLGYVHVMSDEPNNWAQFPSWPCFGSKFEKGFFQGATDDFKKYLREEAERYQENIDWENDQLERLQCEIEIENWKHREDR